MTPLETARSYIAAGLSVIPVCLDGTKAPAFDVLPRLPDERGGFRSSWKPYQQRLATLDELERWFARPRPYAIALACGKVSGGLECLDFDDRNAVRGFLKEVHDELPDLFAKLSLEETPNGAHIWYRVAGAEVPGNRKLAFPSKRECERTGQKFQALIETRGEGGYAVVAGSPLEAHELRKPYRHVGGPPLSTLAALDDVEREYLIRLAESFDRTDAPTRPATSGNGELSPADDYDLRGEPFSELLPEATFVRPETDEGKARRPGKERGVSATVGYCRGSRNEPLLKVFTTSWPPFEGGKCYGRFHVLRLTRFGGDGAACMRELRKRGFGSEKWKPAPDGSPSGAAERIGRLEWALACAEERISKLEWALACAELRIGGGGVA